MDLKLYLNSTAAGLCLVIGMGTILKLKDYEIVGIFIFLIGIGNLYFMLKGFGMEKLKSMEFALKYPSFLILIIGVYLASMEAWNFRSIAVFYLGLAMLWVALMIRAKRLRKK